MTTALSAQATKERRRIPGFAGMQRIGRSLMLPIAALPAAALLLRFGADDMLGSDGVGKYWSWMVPVAHVMAGAGGALFDNLALLFAIGIAIGFAKKSEGATAVAGLVGYLVFTGVCKVLAPFWGSLPQGVDPQTATPAMQTINYGVLGGIATGLLAAVLYDKFYRTKLPSYLAFFGGRRFVPIITAVAAMALGVAMSAFYPIFSAGFTALGDWVAQPGNQVVGGFVYGVANRLLVPLGLHHLLNSIPWFQVGSFQANGVTYEGDIARFLHGDPTAGTFMTGFFPIMMFALPAAAIAMWRVAAPARRPVIGGIMISSALTSFLTGISEPLEFSFVYVAFPLYAVHAVLVGASLALCNALDLHMGFGFSAGATDFLLNMRLSTQAGTPPGHWGWMNPLLIVLIGLAFAAVYYLLFYCGIKLFNFKTPGREDDNEPGGGGAMSVLDEAQVTASETKTTAPAAVT